MSRAELHWQPADWVQPTAGVAVAAVIAAVALGRPDLLVFDAPLVGALAGAWWGRRTGRELSLEVSLSPDRCFEGDIVDLQVQLRSARGVELGQPVLRTGSGVTAQPVETEWPSSSSVRARWELTARRWGRTALELRVDAQLHGGVFTSAADLEVGEIAVFPDARSLEAVPRPLDLPDLLGMHLGRQRGQGVEFAGIRPYQPGDSLRQINWPVSARRGELHITQRLAEQAAQVVALIDATGDIAQRDASSLDLALHGALDVVRAALRQGDRAGVVALGSGVRWVVPDLGRRQFYRVVQAVLDVQVGSGKADSDVGRLPRTALPPGAAVIAFTPLLDQQVLAVLHDLRSRGYGVAVVDVLRAEPASGGRGDPEGLIARMWGISRRALNRRLADLGVPVVTWSDGESLDEALGPVAQRPLLGRPR